MIPLSVSIDGLETIKARLIGKQKQIPYAASRALNTLAFSANADIKTEMQRVFKGGATPYTLRAFKVDKATKEILVAMVSLRTDTPNGGTAYTKALSHLFTGGTREWKRIEGLLRGLALIPAGMMIVPGAACPLDSRGNMRKSALDELLGVIRANVRNLRVFRRAGKTSKQQKGIGYFVILPGDKTHLQPGIWKRIETGSGSVVKPMILYVRRGHWNQFIDLQKIGTAVVGRLWQAEFDRELANAMASAR